MNKYPCSNCPVACSGICVAMRFNASNLCDHMNPEHPLYQPQYKQVIIDKSCGTNEYKIQIKQPSSGTMNGKVEPMSFMDAGKNLVSSLFNYAKDGFKNVPDEVYSERMSICNSCDNFDKSNNRCGICHCFMNIKNHIPNIECPAGKFGKYEQNIISPAVSSCGVCG